MTDTPHHVIPHNLVGPGDTVAALAIISAIFDWLPTILGVIAGFLGIAWYLVLFYDRFWLKKTNHN